MSTIKKITDAAGHVVPMAEPTTTQALDLWVDNETGHRDLVYGTRAIKGASPAHDHGHNGGVKVSWPLAQGSFRGNPTTTGVNGISLGYDMLAILDLVTEPKRLPSIPLFVPGGVLSVQVAITISCPSDQDNFAFKAVVGNFEQSNFAYSKHPSPAKVALAGTVVDTWGGVMAGEIDLSGLGDCTVDREYELVIYQSYTPGAYPSNSLVAYMVTAKTFTLGRRATQGDAPRAVVQPWDILGGAVTPELTSRIKAVENQRSISLLGRAPGLRPDLTPDLARDYQQQIYYPHQHQGVLVPDGQGGLFSDGKIVRRGYGHAFVNDVGTDATPSTIDALPARGFLSHRPGAFTFHTKRISIAAGCPYLDLRFALAPVTDLVVTRMIVLFGLYLATDQPYSSASYTDRSLSPLVSLSSGRHDRASSYYTGLNLQFIQCDPVDNPLWVPNREIREDAGAWTRHALKASSEIPDGMVADNAYRVSETITATLTHPALRATDTAHKTQEYDVFFRPFLETGAVDTFAYDTLARLLWWQVIPRDMEP
jgi:hypothetical protein